jgi:hypothetical protein
MSLALDGQKHLIEVPLVTGPRPATTQVVGILLAKLTALCANGLIGHDHAAFHQQLFDIAEAEAEAEIQHTAWLMISTGKR